jgi:hypothetical protein
LNGPILDLIAPIRPLQLCADEGYQLRFRSLEGTPNYGPRQYRWEFLIFFPHRCTTSPIAPLPHPDPWRRGALPWPLAAWPPQARPRPRARPAWHGRPLAEVATRPLPYARPPPQLSWRFPAWRGRWREEEDVILWKPPNTKLKLCAGI